MNNYYLYKIVYLLDDSQCYVGATKDLTVRMASHKEESKTKTNKLYTFVNANGGWDNFDFELLEEVIDISKEQRYELEREWFDKISPTLNTQKPNQMFGVGVVEYKKQWCVENQDRIKIERADYYQTNKPQIQQYREQSWQCSDCEAVLTIQHKARHLKVCKGKVIVIDPKTQFLCPHCDCLKGKKHKARHIKLCKDASETPRVSINNKFD